MTRNLDKRIELMFPVEIVEHKAKVLYALRAMFRDTAKARWLAADGEYQWRAPASGEPQFRAQAHLREEARRLASLAPDREGISFRPEESARRRGARSRR
jgi:polyphosphate kinase